jgi:hypothetical protein
MGDRGTTEAGAPMHGLGPEAIERDILDTFNDVDRVSLGDGSTAETTYCPNSRRCA